MDRCQKIDCRTNGEVILRVTRPLHLKGPKHLFTGSSAKPKGSRSPISTKNGIDSHLELDPLTTLVQIGFLKTPYFGQHNEDGTQINPIMPLNTLSLGVLRAYKQLSDPVILDSKMNA